MMKNSSPPYGNFTSTDRLMSHWKERRQVVHRSRARIRTREIEKIVDPDFDEFGVEDLLVDFDLGRDRDADGS
jgi:hypothetical protein